MKPLYDELSLPISITISDRERIFRWRRAHRSHERFTRPKWGPLWWCRRSADCTTARYDGLPERARIKPCPYWRSDFLVRRVLAHRCASQRIWFTRFKQGPQAHRPLRFVWKNNFDPWAAPNFREAQCAFWDSAGEPQISKVISLAPIWPHSSALSGDCARVRALSETVMHKRFILLLGVVLGSYVPMSAQTPAPQTIPAQDLTVMSMTVIPTAPA